MESVDIRALTAEIERRSHLIESLRTGMHQAIVGQSHLIDSLLIGLLSGGHILLEGLPGLAKTLAIKTLSQLISADYKRIQFTPDLLPADVVGTLMYSQKQEDFSVKKGPIFSNFILADEINRAPAKVQSALLEAMQEHQVTIEQEGTYPLPEAQVDRFMLKVLISYPKKEEEAQIIRQQIRPESQQIRPVVSIADILELRRLAAEVYIDEKIERYIVDIVFATRQPADYGLENFKSFISFGASPRASINLALAARSYALMKGRGYVIPEDVRAVCYDVLRHRIGLSYEAEAQDLTSDELIKEILNRVEVP